MFRASLWPSSGEQDRRLLRMVFCTVCAGCGCVELCRKLCALCEGYCSTHCTVHTAYDTAPHNHRQHKQCRTPYAVIHGLVLLMMGIMMAETCWNRSLIINIGLVASYWFISLHPTFHDARSQEPKTYNAVSISLTDSHSTEQAIDKFWQQCTGAYIILCLWTEVWDTAHRPTLFFRLVEGW